MKGLEYKHIPDSLFLDCLESTSKNLGIPVQDCVEAVSKTTLIKTKSSFLTCGMLFDDVVELIFRLTKEIEPFLLVRPEIKVMGNIGHQNRNLCFLSDESVGYKYSSYLAKSTPLTEDGKKLLEIVSKLYNTKFNGILVNKYVDGRDNIGKHSDDERDLSDVGVVAVSYGATRKFRIRDKFTGEIVKDIPVVSGSILHMGGNFQKEFTHEIPKELKVKEPRWSFTFRHHQR